MEKEESGKGSYWHFFFLTSSPDYVRPGVHPPQGKSWLSL